jgi:hypothetical protein
VLDRIGVERRKTLTVGDRIELERLAQPVHALAEPLQRDDQRPWPDCAGGLMENGGAFDALMREFDHLVGARAGDNKRKDCERTLKNAEPAERNRACFNRHRLNS